MSLSTHAILDSFTVYGTQLFWPLSEYPVGISNLFIIDPAYTLPLLLCLLLALSLPQHLRPQMPNGQLAKDNSANTTANRRSIFSAKKINHIGLAISTAYIVWSLVAKVMVDNTVNIALQERDITSTQFVSTPAPLTTFLWRLVVMTDEGFYEGYVSIFDSPQQLSLQKYDSQAQLLANLENEWGVQRLKWFTKGFYAVNVDSENNTLVFSDLRMGVQCAYVFNFVVGKYQQQKIVPGSYEKFSMRPPLNKVGAIWDRVWDSTVPLSPKPDSC